MNHRGNGRYWLAHLKQHGGRKQLIETKVLFKSDYLSEVRKWRDYYVNLWSANTDPKFINAQRKKTRPSMRGENNPMYGVSLVRKNNLRWYNDGVRNIYVKEGTQPRNFKAGRRITYKKPHTAKSKFLIAQKHKRAVIDPEGVRYDSLKLAAIRYGCSSAAISGLIKRGVSGWKYEKPDPVTDPAIPGDSQNNPKGLTND